MGPLAGPTSEHKNKEVEEFKEVALSQSRSTPPWQTLPASVYEDASSVRHGGTLDYERPKNSKKSKGSKKSRRNNPVQPPWQTLPASVCVDASSVRHGGTSDSERPKNSKMARFYRLRVDWATAGAAILQPKNSKKSKGSKKSRRNNPVQPPWQTLPASVYVDASSVRHDECVAPERRPTICQQSFGRPSGAWVFLFFDPWGLRPRLYSAVLPGLRSTLLLAIRFEPEHFQGVAHDSDAPSERDPGAPHVIGIAREVQCDQA